MYSTYTKGKGEYLQKKSWERCFVHMQDSLDLHCILTNINETWQKQALINNLQELYIDKHQWDWKKAITDKNNLQELLRETQEEVKVKEEQLQVWMRITFIITKGIPHICHFFYTGKIFGELNLHQKTPIFCVKSVKKNANFLR